jgi:hypothetical protein
MHIPVITVYKLAYDTYTKFIVLHSDSVVS